MMEELKTFLKKVDEKIDLDRQLSYAFFITFSRFEYALKICKYLAGDKNRPDRNADSDWDLFARSNELKFNAESDEELKKAVDYLTKNPPKKQVVDANGVLYSRSYFL